MAAASTKEPHLLPLLGNHLVASQDLPVPTRIGTVEAGIRRGPREFQLSPRRHLAGGHQLLQMVVKLCIEAPFNVVAKEKNEQEWFSDEGSTVWDNK